jgi:hypothetical protein
MVGGVSISGWRAVVAGAVVTVVVGTGVAAAATPAVVGSSAVTARVPVGPGRQQANGENFEPAISADGRFVAFTSYASNLVPGDTNNHIDVFVRDRVAQVTQRISVGPGGHQVRRERREYHEPAVRGDRRLPAAAVGLLAGWADRDPAGHLRHPVPHEHIRAVVSVPSHQVRCRRLKHDEPAVRGHGGAAAVAIGLLAASGRHPARDRARADSGRSGRRGQPRPDHHRRNRPRHRRPPTADRNAADHSNRPFWTPLTLLTASADRHPSGHLRRPVPNEHVVDVVGIPGHQVRRGRRERHEAAVRGDRREQADAGGLLAV